MTKSSKVKFSCGTICRVVRVVAEVSEYGVGASDRSLAIAKRLLTQNLERATELFEFPIFLRVSAIDELSVEVALPETWVAVHLWTIASDRKLRNCGVQWYQDSFVIDPVSSLQDWADHVSWRDVVGDADRTKPSWLVND